MCACFYFEYDPELTEDLEVPTCTCGHALDEHDKHGDCQVDVR